MAPPQIETVSNTSDKVKMLAVGALVVASLACFYFLRGKGSSVQWAVLLVGLVVAGLVFFTAEQGRRLFSFAGDAWREMRKVVWPARKEALQTTAFVFAFAVVMALFLWLTDKTIEWVLYGLILGWGG